VGPNGAGKTTALRCIMSLLNTDAGEVLFYGAPFRQNKKALAKTGYLPGALNLYGEMTVTGLLKYSASFYRENTLEKAGELLHRFSLDGAKRLDRLSAGDLKKAGIILALMHSPSLIVMDEPTEGLDPPAQEELYRIIFAEKAKGTAFLLSLRRLSAAKKLCDNIIFIKNGRVLKALTAKELTNPLAVRVKLETPDEPDIGLKITERRGDEYTFICENDINDLIRRLEKYRLKKLLIEEPSLEEIFAHYYR